MAPEDIGLAITIKIARSSDVPSGAWNLINRKISRNRAAIHLIKPVPASFIITPENVRLTISIHIILHQLSGVLKI